MSRGRRMWRMALLTLGWLIGWPDIPQGHAYHAEIACARDAWVDHQQRSWRGDHILARENENIWGVVEFVRPRVLVGDASQYHWDNGILLSCGHGFCAGQISFADVASDPLTQRLPRKDGYNQRGFLGLATDVRLQDLLDAALEINMPREEGMPRRRVTAVFEGQEHSKLQAGFVVNGAVYDPDIRSRNPSSVGVLHLSQLTLENPSGHDRSYGGHYSSDDADFFKKITYSLMSILFFVAGCKFVSDGVDISRDSVNGGLVRIAAAILCISIAMLVMFFFVLDFAYPR